MRPGDSPEPMDVAHGTPALGQVAELAKQLAEAQHTRAGLDKQLSALCRQIGDGQPSIGGESRSGMSEHMTFEQALTAHLADTGDSMADQQQQQPLDPAQAAFEAKYNCLKSRFRKMEDSYRHELDALHEEIAVLQDRMKKLDAARAQAQNNEATLAETLQKTTTQVSSELVELCCENHALSCENHELMQELISAKVALAQCAEREVIWRREMFKARQTNKQLAQKMGRLESLVSVIVDKDAA
ncbi:hypothetical protein OEZ86_011561 [Tetradesmus obliquus]|nr:hypothetical protein OEZ86_011561 [Tetradesmus obliquus]